MCVWGGLKLKFSPNYALFRGKGKMGLYVFSQKGNGSDTVPQAAVMMTTSPEKRDFKAQVQSNFSSISSGEIQTTNLHTEFRDPLLMDRQDHRNT